MKFKKTFSIALAAFSLLSAKAFAQPITYTVQPGDSMWKIAVKYQVGLSEIRGENPSITNAALIYPGQKILIPNYDDVKAQENEVIRLVNIQRANNGLQMLTGNWQLSRVARFKSQDMAKNNYFSHMSPTYGSPFDMMKSFGLTFVNAGENIAEGQRTPQEVMNAWMNSPGHRANILSPSFTEIGVGLAKDSSGRLYWTQDFMKPM